MPITDVEKIVTRRIGLPESWTLRSYLDNGGYESLRKALQMGPAAVQQEVDTANLLGRGGAGFEAGKKWSLIRDAYPRYLVINGDESEPATFKDHMLLENDPHQVVEGTIITAFALGVTHAFIYVRGEFALGIERMTAAVNEAYEHGALGTDIFGSGFSLDIVIHPGAGAYICGEETALLESLEGKRGFPRIKPPYFPAAIGLYGAPTMVNNVETMSNIPWIVMERRRRLRRARRRAFDRHADLRLVRPRQQAGQLRARDGQGQLPGPDLRPQGRGRHPQRARAQGLHPRRRLGAVVRAPAPRRGPRSERGRRRRRRDARRGRFDAGFGVDRGHG